MKYIFVLVSLLVSTGMFPQNGDSENYFASPLEVPLILSGTFAELRSNHFHGGLDIKTQQREGLRVVAAAEGYISRINVSPWGYGKALYIQHPNGYTTVYGHLQAFSPEIEAYVRKLQYSRESYSLEVYPEKDELVIGKGEFIALSGNTGGSGGPHLHFEIRDWQQHPMNPLLFGYDIKDSRAPTINSLFVYPIGEEAHVNHSTERQKLPLSLQSDGSYNAPKIEACGDIGFGISAVDQLDMAHNRNGVFRIEASVNGNKIFQANFEKFSFAESRHINQFVDYEYYREHRSKIQKLFVEESNPLSIYSNLFHQGLVNVQDSLSYNYVIKVSDYAGNERIIRIPIEGEFSSSVSPKNENITNYFVSATESTLFEEHGIDVYFPAGSIYQDTYLDISFENEKVRLHEDNIPIHSNVSIGFDVSKYKPADQEKMFIAKLSPNGRPYYSATEKKENRFITEIRNFGEFTLARDDTPPVVTPVNFKNGQWISANKDLQVKIYDNLTGIKSYRATVNGKFILMEYEYKENLLTHHFSDGAVTETENLFQLTVTDNVGNLTVYESTFFRKP